MTEVREEWADLSDDELLVRLRQRGTPLHEASRLVKWRDNGVTVQVIDDVIDRGW